MKPWILVALVAIGVCACSSTPPDVKPQPDPQPPPQPAKTTLKPPPGPFNDELTVTFETDVPAKVHYSTDGSDPRSGKDPKVGDAPYTVKIKETTTFTFGSRSRVNGLDEELRSAQYIRAGGKPGTASGVVVVGGVAVGTSVAVLVDGAVTELGKIQEKGEIPFRITSLGSGRHRLVAMSDRNGDGRYWPLVDYSSDPYNFTLDLKDPFKASVEGVRLYLGESQPGLCTIMGAVTFERAVGAQNLTVAALSPDALSAGANPQALLAQLGSGYRVFTNDTDTAYPYVITDLEPGRYLPVPLLNGFGGGGVAMNLMVNPFKQMTCKGDDVLKADFLFGGVALHGTVTIKPAKPPGMLTYGVVAARNATLQGGIQAVLMPTFFGGSATEFKGNYAGQALRETVTFDLRAFTSLEPGVPITAALAWVMNPFAPEKPHAQAHTVAPEKQQDFTVP
jgi:hypothetical protein